MSFASCSESTENGFASSKKALEEVLARFDVPAIHLIGNHEVFNNYEHRTYLITSSSTILREMSLANYLERLKMVFAPHIDFVLV